MKAILGQKIGMTTILDDEGKAIPVTLIQAGPIKVTQVKTTETDGYNAVQVAYGEQKRISKPLAGHTKKASVKPAFIREFRTNDVNEGVAVGDSFDVTTFETGDKVQVSGTSKGKGFAGTVKRWNFRTSAESHGGKGVVRRPGSIGSMYPQKVFRGKKMAGQMGSERVSTKNLTVALVDKENNLLGIKGAVPGTKQALIEIRGEA